MVTLLIGSFLWKAGLILVELPYLGVPLSPIQCKTSGLSLSRKLVSVCVSCCRQLQRWTVQHLFSCLMLSFLIVFLLSRSLVLSLSVYRRDSCHAVLGGTHVPSSADSYTSIVRFMLNMHILIALFKIIS